MMDRSTTVEELLSFYMGKNTQDRQVYYGKLKVELDVVEAAHKAVLLLQIVLRS